MLGVIGLLALVGAAAVWWGAKGKRPLQPKVVLIGIDGGDWRLIRPLIDRGELPAFARLVTEGATAVLSSYGKMMSPQVWNTIVTGKHFSEHGIDWFVVRLDDPASHAELEGDAAHIPITSRQRRVPAVWDIVSQAELTTGVIGFWATWPATPVNGYMVSDRFSYSRVNKVGGADVAARYQTYPAELADELRPLLMTPDQVGVADRQRFMAADVESGDWRVSHDLVGEFDITYAQTQTYRRVGLHMLEKGQPDFWGIYFQGVDVISHYFWEFMRPEHAGREVPAEAVERYAGAIETFYKHQDVILGEILARLERNTVVIVASDHGFRDLPFGQRGVEHISGWHRIQGILAIWGPGVRAGITLADADVFDVTPTILALLNRPVARDMPGRVLIEAFEDNVLGDPSWVESYTVMPEVPPISPEELRSPMDRDIMERLESIGYIGGPTEARKPEPGA